MFNSLLSGSSLRLHLADKGACVSQLDPDTLALITQGECKLYLGGR